MRLRILIGGLVMAAGCAGPVSAGVINSAVFGGNLTVAAMGEPWYYEDESGLPHWEYLWQTDVMRVTQFANYTGNVSATTTWPCTIAEGGWDCTGAASYNTQAIGQASVTGATAPILKAMGQTENAEAWATVTLGYSFRLDKLAPDAPDDTWVPITIQGGGLLFAGDSPSDPDLKNTYAYARAAVWYQGPADYLARSLLDDRVWNSSDPSNYTFSYGDTECLQAGQPATVSMAVYGFSGGYPSMIDTGGLFQAVLDPQIDIDPGYWISYQGHQVLATDLYSLTFSPELV